MDGYQIIRAAIPGASAELCEHVLWGRTPFPCGTVYAKTLYRAAHGFIRATRQGKNLCDWCHRLASPDGYLCDGCREALS